MTNTVVGESKQTQVAMVVSNLVIAEGGGGGGCEHDRQTNGCRGQKAFISVPLVPLRLDVLCQ